MWVTSSLSMVKTPTVVALGNFDGVHWGHQQVIQSLLSGAVGSVGLRMGEIDLNGAVVNGMPLVQGYSDRCSLLLDACEWLDPPHLTPPSIPSPLSAGPWPTVVTFYPHPREFFSGQPQPWLTPLEEKATLLRALGVRQLVLLPFNQELAALSPHAFVNQVLIERLQAQHISVGANFQFGHRRAGTVDDLSALAAAQGVTVSVMGLSQTGGDRISSSRIRAALTAGNLAEVAALMGRPYHITGRVVKGQQLGRQLGFPTANLRLPADKFLPSHGVYGVQVYGIPDQPAGVPLSGVMNLGNRPTVAGQSQTLEVHLLDWQGDLYGRTLTVALVEFLRPERRFDSLDDLKTQIQRDCEQAAAVLGDRPIVKA
ncbi:MAG: bifunctional riboflavin kinase/FAD synthetase [Leptolyngbya sp. RL_3_1]|nr:bifunctional riboflavin kinase/FAD synthetase [Leptolyngbya sp. RL_3_1]